jgi:hypothetical protein
VGLIILSTADNGKRLKAKQLFVAHRAFLRHANACASILATRKAFLWNANPCASMLATPMAFLWNANPCASMLATHMAFLRNANACASILATRKAFLWNANPCASMMLPTKRSSGTRLLVDQYCAPPIVPPERLAGRRFCKKRILNCTNRYISNLLRPILLIVHGAIVFYQL